MSQTIHPEEGDALVIVDVQNDFLPGGSLAVADGNEVVPVLDAYIALFVRQHLPVIATRDWHPSDHSSFKAQGGPWPPHCIAGTIGAAFASALTLPRDALIVSKAERKEHDAYSGFEGTELDALLQGSGVARLWVGGLATDYCVLNTVKDALRLGYQVNLLQDAIRAVNVRPDDGIEAIAAMASLGAEPHTLADVAT